MTVLKLTLCFILSFTCFCGLFICWKWDLIGSTSGIDDVDLAKYPFLEDLMKQDITTPATNEDHTQISRQSEMLRPELFFERQNGTLVACPKEPPCLIGPLDAFGIPAVKMSASNVLPLFPSVKRGGEWTPPFCKAIYKIAIIIPYRDREVQLYQLIMYLIPILMRQLVDFRFIVVEQVGKGLFNKGRLMNHGFRFAKTLHVECVVFHDVDMLPTDDRNLYHCPKMPRHMSPVTDAVDFAKKWEMMPGGVFSIRMDQFEQINGFSNSYWGWGGEDDDMGDRIELMENLTLSRPPKAIGSYVMLLHGKRKPSPKEEIRKLLERVKERRKIDGVNYPEGIVKSKKVQALFYHLLVEVGRPPLDWYSGQ